LRVGYVGLAMNHERHPLNVDGPFYVENGECMSCGAPEVEADGLMSHDEGGHCFFVVQPQSDDQVDSAIRATWASCCGAVRYGGNDVRILTRFGELGDADLCDNPISLIEPIRRNEVHFEWCDSKLSGMRSTSRAILIYIAASMTHHKDCGYEDLSCDDDQASFLYVWAKSLKEDRRYSIRISVTRAHNDFWTLALSENEVAGNGTAMHVDKILRRNSSVRLIRWFSDGERGRGEAGRLHPY
jgi:hypothetical protein